MLTDGQGRVFVGRRLDTPDAWQMPQGGIDDGESPRQAAMRELLLKTPREQCAHEHFPCASAIALEIGEDGAARVAK